MMHGQTKIKLLENCNFGSCLCNNWGNSKTALRETNFDCRSLELPRDPV